MPFQVDTDTVMKKKKPYSLCFEKCELKYKKRQALHRPL